MSEQLSDIMRPYSSLSLSERLSMVRKIRHMKYVEKPAVKKREKKKKASSAKAANARKKAAARKASKKDSSADIKKQLAKMTPEQIEQMLKELS